MFLYNGRLANEDSDLDSSRDTSSEGSIDYEFGKSCNLSREQWVHHHLACESAITMRKTSLRDEHSTRQEGFSSDDGDAEYPRSGLLFQFLEQDLPYQRVPLADKVSGFLLVLLVVIFLHVLRFREPYSFTRTVYVMTDI